MSQERLSNLAILSIEKDLVSNLDYKNLISNYKNLISNFAPQKARKINFK